MTGIVLDADMNIHTEISPGGVERVYEKALNDGLSKRKMRVERQLALPIEYEDIFIEDAVTVDLLVEDKLGIEIKSVEKISPVHFKQVRT